MDAGAIADNIVRVLGDERLRADLVRRGLERASAFSWDRSVARTREVYASLGTPAHG
jgi:glycosyltransferase involved in cell wall biosynthesis